MLFKNSRANIIFSGSEPKILHNDEAALYQFRTNKKLCWFAFSGVQNDVTVKQGKDDLVSVSLLEPDKKETFMLNPTDKPVLLKDKGKRIEAYEAILLQK